MLKLELEQILEDGFRRSGVELGRRVYREEILVGASVDEAVSGISLRDHPEKMLQAPRFQRDAFFAEQTSLIFERRIDNYEGWLIEYGAYSHEEEANYEQAANRIIQEGKIYMETIGFGNRDTGLFYLITIDDKGIAVDSSFDIDTVMEAYRAIFGKEALNEKLAIIKSLRESPYDPKKAYQAVIDLMR